MQSIITKKNTKPIVIVICCVTAMIIMGTYLHFWTTYTGAQTNQEDISFQIDQIWIYANAPIMEDFAIEDKLLAAAEAELDAQQQLFPTRMNSMKIMRTLLEMAKKHDVTITLQTQEFPAGSHEFESCTMLQSSVQTSGTLDDLQNFVSYLEDGPIRTLELEEVNFGGSGESWTASFSIRIYTQIPSSTETSQEV